MSDTMEKKYKKPPIVEALIDIKFALENPLPALEIADRLGRLIGNEYPVKKEVLRTNSLRIGVPTFFPPPHIQAVGQFLCGIQFLKPDEVVSLDAAVDFFVFRVTKYESWEEFKPLAAQAWESFLKITGPGTINRIAIRYTNEFPIPKEWVNEDDLFKPTIYNPAGDIANVQGYAVQMTIDQPDIDSQVILQRWIEEVAESNGEIKIVLDIDTFSDNLALDILNAEPVWEVLEKLHKRGKEYFNRSISNKIERFIDRDE